MNKQARISGIAVAAILLITFCGGNQIAAASANPEGPRTEPRLVTVTGDAEVKVVPDEVILTLGVETGDKELATAKKQNDEIVKRVLALAEDYGVAPKDIQTDYISVEPRYRDSYDKKDFIGYFVRKTIVITLRDMARFEDLLTAVLDAGVNYVHGIDFRTTQLRKYRDEARALAIKAAREKAVAVAGELGQEVGQPHTINEDQSGWWSWYSAWWGGRGGGGMTQNVIQNSGGIPPETEGAIAPGQISVNARITVSFELK